MHRDKASVSQLATGNSPQLITNVNGTGGPPTYGGAVIAIVPLPVSS